MTYFGFTIGPVYRTIFLAQKTRELWAASFLYSKLMHALLGRLQEYGTVLAPHDDFLILEETWHGAGIWPDRCFLLCDDANKAESLKNKIGEICSDAVSEMSNLLGGRNEDFLKRWFHIYAACLDGTAEELAKTAPVKATPDAPDETFVIFRLNKLLDDLELQAKFVGEGDKSPLDFFDINYKNADGTGKVLDDWYLLGFEIADKAFVKYECGPNKPNRRLPSIPEIATRAFRNEKFVIDKKEYSYADIVEKPINQAICQGKDKPENDSENLIFPVLKKGLGDRLLQQHRNICIVQADGDGIGNTIAGLGNQPDKIRAFSKELMDFATSAANAIHDFGALPVYAGGDDLLFISPVSNERGETIFDLLKTLDGIFNNKKKMPNLTAKNATLSFGLSISYYKYPMAESLQNAYHALFHCAKKLENVGSGEEKTKKNALAWQFLTHSGNPLPGVLQRSGKAWEIWRDMIQDAPKLKAAFMSGLVHRLEKLAPLLADAHTRGTMAEFFDRHFNEASGVQKEFLKRKVEPLCTAFFNEYSSADIIDDPKFFKKPSSPSAKPEYLKPEERPARLLYSALRLLQFLNAPDHE